MRGKWCKKGGGEVLFSLKKMAGRRKEGKAAGCRWAKKKRGEKKKKKKERASAALLNTFPRHDRVGRPISSERKKGRKEKKGKKNQNHMSNCFIATEPQLRKKGEKEGCPISIWEIGKKKERKPAEPQL